MAALLPEGLTKKELELLTNCANEVSETSPVDLLKKAGEHLEKAQHAYADNVFVNFQLAETIYHTFETIVEQWENHPEPSRPWLRGMIRYFTLSSDLEDDFTSPIGFDDDVDIMNACLKLAGREDLCIKDFT